MTKRNWDGFCETAHKVMQDALDNKITLTQASEFFENDRTVENKDLRRYLEYIIWEIDGSRKFYIEIIDLFERRASEDELLRILKL